MKRVANACVDLGDKFSTGNSRYATELLYALSAYRKYVYFKPAIALLSLP